MYFLYHATTRPTGRPIAKALQMRCGLDFARCPANVQLLVRWGNSSALPPGSSPRLEFNKAESIQKASNKTRAFTIWRDAELSCVETTTDRVQATLWLAQGATILGRSRYGTRGSGIRVYGPEVDLFTVAVHDFYSKYIPDTREYRLHVVGDHVVRVQRKYLEYPDLVRNPFVRNVDEGYVYKSPRQSLHSSRLRLAIKAIKALGLDFGAIDMIIDRAGIAHVLEANSAPACSPLTGAAYVASIASMIYDRTDGAVDLPPALGELDRLREN